ncbi:alpha/beta hydrolase [Desulfatibacillum aliphaticivorans]|uniref:alpha/beta hydrolase n=1 Tax=Desulfatibacillum aliphaticivorans TaxID=218208 RepID=UPI000422C8C0|nr:alpha/beta hydrolase [Desulfatibacillum aliphaticivorans]
MQDHPIHGKPGPLGRVLFSTHPVNISFHRIGLESGSALLNLPAGTQVRPFAPAGVPASYISGHGDAKGRKILYLHGGGYMVGSRRTHKSLAAYLSKIAKAECVLPDYRRAPEHPFPAALEDVYAVYLAMLDQGIDPQCIALAGDSAGGGLTAALLLALKAMGKPLPSCAYLMSPWVNLADNDLHFKAPFTKRTDIADWFCHFMSHMYVGQCDPAHPFVSPVFGDFQGLPPLFVTVGKYEPLCRQAEELAERAQMAGVDVTFKPYRSYVHVLQALAPFSKRIHGLLAKGGDFIHEHCPA